jgi:hypothetical protein
MDVMQRDSTISCIERAVSLGSQGAQASLSRVEICVSFLSMARVSAALSDFRFKLVVACLVAFAQGMLHTSKHAHHKQDHLGMTKSISFSFITFCKSIKARFKKHKHLQHVPKSTPKHPAPPSINTTPLTHPLPFPDSQFHRKDPSPGD